jgi:hypothetical protein
MIQVRTEVAVGYHNTLSYICLIYPHASFRYQLAPTGGWCG